MTTKIILHELALSCFIGIDEAEKHVRQRLLVDAAITLTAAPADEISATYDYRQAVMLLRRLAEEKHHGLLESFAREAAVKLLEHPCAQAVRVYCRKPAVFADIAAAGVEVQLAKATGEE